MNIFRYDVFGKPLSRSCTGFSGAVGWAAESHTPGNGFSDARALTLLAALSTSNHVIPSAGAENDSTAHPHHPRPIFYSRAFHQKPLSIYRRPVPK
jgi:hypothetical protein